MFIGDLSSEVLTMTEMWMWGTEVAGDKHSPSGYNNLVFKSKA